MRLAHTFLSLTTLIPYAVFARLDRSVHSSVQALERHRRLSEKSLNDTHTHGLELTSRADDGKKYVFMHHIVGNTYPYTQANWATDIGLMLEKGVDAIALNVGSDWWQQSRVEDAYRAAEGTAMKMFISFDYTAFDCSSATQTITWVNKFKAYPAQFYYDGRPMISSFAGSCMGPDEWSRMKRETNGYLMPFMWGLENQFNNAWWFLDSWLCWGCAWPRENTAINFNDDNYYIGQLGKRFATTVSMAMFTHYSWENKNFYQRGDDFLISQRWEDLISNRDRLTFVEMVTWNDWGESDYFGPFGGDQPQGTYWAQNYPHTAFFDLSKYYITAYKTGSYPAITQDAIYYWAHPHPSWADAPQDPLPKPDNYAWATEYMYAVVLATSDATVTLGIGGCQTDFSVTRGVNKLKIQLCAGQMRVKMMRNNQQVIYQNPTDFQYSWTTDKYNLNFYASAALGPSQSSPPASSSTSVATSTSTSAAPPSSSSTSWSALGCYPEGTTNSRRALSAISTSSSDMTPAKCTAFCADYAYAGLEYKTECYCGNALTDNGASGSPIDNGQCNTQCEGDKSQTCGGSWTISVYKKGSATTQTGQTTWSDYGCVADSTTRALAAATFSQSDMTTSKCQALCANYDFAGTEYGSECYCANSITQSGSSGLVVSAGECNSKCSGDASKTCGGSWRLNVYKKESTTPSTSSAWTSRGCFTDGNDRLLRDAYSSLSGMTTDSCISYCSNKGFTMAAAEYYNQCYCGNVLYKTNGAGVSAAASDCNTPCEGNSAQSCGGSWRANVYTAPGTSFTRRDSIATYRSLWGLLN